MKFAYLGPICLVATLAPIGALAGSSPSSPMSRSLMDASPVARWVGFYVGVNAGYGGGNVDAVSETGGGTEFYRLYGATRSSFRTGGALAGGQIGYNYTLNRNFLVGGETDFNWADVRESTSSAGFSTIVSAFNPKAAHPQVLDGQPALASNT